MNNKIINSDLIFCSIIYPGENAEINSLLLAASIRTFGGKLASCPIWFMFPENGKEPSTGLRKLLEELNIQLVPFPVKAVDPNFFFIKEIIALNQVETLAEEKTNLLAWLDSYTLLFHEPKKFLLTGDYKLAHSPVHHLLLGSKYDLPIEPFWQEIYKHCDVPQERIFPMQPMVENIRMRPYFNAGILISHPRNGLFQCWYNKFQEVYQLPVFRSFYKNNHRFEIFLHQAILSGVILNQFDPTELYELPQTYNYPSHLWLKDGTNNRPSDFDEIITLRHEGFFKDVNWKKKMPIKPEKLTWLENHLQRFKAARQ